MASRRRGRRVKQPDSPGNYSPGDIPGSPEHPLGKMADSAEEKQHEMLSLMRSIITEGITAGIDKLQPQLNFMKTELKECNKKLTEVEQALSGIEDRVSSLEKANELLQKENTE